MEEDAKRSRAGSAFARAREKLKAAGAGSADRLRRTTHRMADALGTAAERIRETPTAEKLGAALETRRVVRRAAEARQRGNAAMACRLLEAELHERPGDPRVVAAFWESALESGRAADAVDAVLPVIRSLAGSDGAEAARLWRELVTALPDVRADAGTLVRLVPVLLEEEVRWPVLALQHALDPRAGGLTPGLAVRVAEYARVLDPPTALRAARIALAAPDLHEARREALHGLVSELEGEGVAEEPVAGALAPAREGPDPRPIPPAEPAVRPASPSASPPRPIRPSEPSPPAPVSEAELDAFEESLEGSDAESETPQWPGETSRAEPEASELELEASELELETPELEPEMPQLEPETGEMELDASDDELDAFEAALEAELEPSEAALEAEFGGSGEGLDASGAEPGLLEAEPVEFEVELDGLEADSDTSEAASSAPEAGRSALESVATPPSRLDELDDVFASLIEPALEAHAPAVRFQGVKVMTAVPTELGEDALDLRVAEGRRARIEYAKIQALAVGEVDGRVLIDLALNWQGEGDGMLRVVRLQARDFDAGALVGGVPEGASGLRALSELLLERTGAIPRPDRDAARGDPIRVFDSLADYEREVLQAAEAPAGAPRPGAEPAPAGGRE